MKRYCTEEPFGIACYEGEVVDGVFEGTHKGIVSTNEDAQLWLRGEQPERLRVVYTDELIAAIKAKECES